MSSLTDAFRFLSKVFAFRRYLTQYPALTPLLVIPTRRIHCDKLALRKMSDLVWAFSV